MQLCLHGNSDVFAWIGDFDFLAGTAIVDFQKSASKHLAP